MRKHSYIILIFISIMFFTLGCNQDSDNKQQLVSENGFYLDTIIDIKIYNPNDNYQDVFEKAFQRIEELEKILSVHIENSDLYNIKKQAGIEPVEVQEETLTVIKKSINYSEISQGYFDITAGPLIDLWGIKPPEGHVPSKEELEEVLTKINYKNIMIDEVNHTVMLKEKGMIANLGAIAKGYIADEIKNVLIENGVERAIINLGGNVLLVGDKPDGSDFSIGIQNPSSGRGAYLGLIRTKNNSLVSSGDYERYFEKDGIKYHHILDPFTGFPANNQIRQVTILSPSSIDCDALSTTAFLLGLEEGVQLIESLEDVQAVFVTEDNKIYLTSGIGDAFEFDEKNYGETYSVIKNTID